MANYTNAVSVHETLEAATVDTVSLTGSATSVTIANRSGSAEIYFTVATGSATATTPTVEGSGTWMVPAAVCALRIQVSGAPVTVKLISSGTPDYSVQAL